MMDFCRFFQGKSSEFAWIPEIPYTMHPLEKSPIKTANWPNIVGYVRGEKGRFGMLFGCLVFFANRVSERGV